MDSKRGRELNSPITIEAIEKVVKEMYSKRKRAQQREYTLLH